MKIKSKKLMLFMHFILTIFLLGCGGTTGTLVAEGGISGTGITMGRITNFGSIFVNGVRFNVDEAVFLRDGVTATGQNEFSTGEYIVIKGSIDATGTSGIASEVSFADILEGSVTQASTDDSTIEILGQTVKIDQLTVFHGFKTLNELIIGNIIEVSGVKDADGLINATSINLKQTSFVDGVSENELKGIVSNLNLSSQTFMINNITVDYAGAILKSFNEQGLENEQFVEVKSNSMVFENNLVAIEVELEDEYKSFLEQTEVEIEGKVTRFTSSTDFDVNGLHVTTIAETIIKNGTLDEIRLNSLLEVEGLVNVSGVLVADEVSFKETALAIELEGQVQNVDIPNNLIEIPDYTVIINASTLMIDESDEKISSFTVSDLKIGDSIKIKGSLLDNQNILASKLEREGIESSDDSNEKEKTESEDSEVEETESEDSEVEEIESEDSEVEEIESEDSEVEETEDNN